MSPVSRRPRGFLAWGTFSILVLVALIFAGGYLVNLTHWSAMGSRGWLGSQGDLHLVAQTLPGAAAAGLAVGDRIETINGARYETLKGMKSLLDLEVGSTNRYEVQRGGEPVPVEVPTAALGVKHALQLYGAALACGVIFIGLGVLVFMMKPRHYTSWSYLLLALSCGVAWPYLWLGPSFQPAWLEAIFVPAMYLVSAALLQLAVMFPQRRSFFADRPFLLALPYAAFLFLAALEIAAHHPDYARSGAPLTNLRLLVFGGSALIFVGSAVETRLRSHSLASRVQALAVLTGALLSGFVPLMDNVYTTAFGSRLLPLGVVPIFFLGLPIATMYAIVQHDLFEIDTIVRRTYGYLLSTTAVIGLYGTTVSVLNVTIGPSAIVQSPFFTVLFVLAMVFVMQPVQARIQLFVDRAFYRRRYDYRKTIMDVSEKMTSMLDPGLVKSTLVDSVTEEMFLENGRLLQPAEPGHVLELGAVAGAGWPAGKPRSIELVPALRTALEEQRVPVFRHQIELDPRYESDRESMAGSFDELDAELMFPLVFEGTTTGVLSLGGKKSGRMFTAEDVDLLRTLVNQSVVALENARLFEEVSDHLKQIHMLESVKSNLAKFVPQRVKELVESGEGEDIFAKREEDVTVLFADITGYTRLSSQIPLDEVNAIIERYFSAFMEEIQAHGGDLNSTEGDGMMVIFRDEDSTVHARAAVRTALGILRRTQELNVEREGATPIGMHIGINSGTASLGAQKIEAGSGSYWVYSATGPTTNLAARLCGFGEELVVSEETQGRLDAYFVTEDLGPQSFKNVPQPVGVHRVTEERPRPDEPSEVEAEVEFAAPEALAVADAVERAGRGQFTILGLLRESESGRALADLVVRAFDKDLAFDDPLGDTTTDEAGRFEIRFTEEFFSDLFERHPDIYLRIFDSVEDREVFTTRDAIRWNAGSVEIFELDIPRERLGRPASG